MVIIVITVLASAGCVSMVTFYEMETVLDEYVGQPLPDFHYPIEWSYNRREIDEETFELVSHRPDDCNYAFVVNKDNLVVLRWYFVKTPPPKDCTFQSVRQLM